MTAYNALKALSERSSKHVVYKQPEMVPHWQSDYEQELFTATMAAIDAGTDPEKVYRLLESIASVDLDEMPAKFFAACVNGGLSPDTDIGGETLLHVLLNHPYPPPIKPPLDHAGVSHQAAEALKPARSGRNPACGSVTLNELLSRKATPNLEDAAGNTALHMLVACMVQRVHFPDPKLPDDSSAADEEVIQAGTMHSDANGHAELMQPAHPQPAAAATGRQSMPEQLEDNDAARAAYAETGFRMLLAAGWSPAWRNHNCYTVTDLIQAGLAKYQSELYDLQDPQGVAQTTVALLAEKAPHSKLHDFLQHKIQGIEAVVNCLQVMHSLSAAAERTRKARSAVSLVFMWLLLVAGAAYVLILKSQLQ